MFYDGHDVKMVPRAWHALTHQYNLIDLGRRSLTYETRLLKYSKRGYAVAVPGLDRGRVDPQIACQSREKLTGLRLLLWYDFRAQNDLLDGTTATTWRRKRRNLTTRVKAYDLRATWDSKYRFDYRLSDYADIDLPWGPTWSANDAVNVAIGKTFACNIAVANTMKPTERNIRSIIDGVTSRCHQKDCDHSSCVLGPIVWVSDNPGRQLLIGSFHPVEDDKWDADVYASDQHLAIDRVCQLAADGRPLSELAAVCPDWQKVTDQYYGRSPYCWAALFGRTALIREMLSSNYQACESYNLDATSLAALGGDGQLMQELLKANMHIAPARVYYYFSCILDRHYDHLGMAVLGGDAEVVRALLALDKPYLSLFQPLHWSGKKKPIAELASPEILALLQEFRPALVNPPATLPQRFRRRKDQVKFRPSVQTADGADAGRHDQLRRVLHASFIGGLPQPPHCKHLAVVDCLSSVAEVAAVRLLNFSQWKEKLATSQWNVRTSDTAGVTPLHVAARYCKVDLIKLLLEAGADAQARDMHQQTPMHYLTSCSVTDVTAAEVAETYRLLQQAGGDNCRNIFGQTPFDCITCQMALTFQNLMINRIEKIRCVCRLWRLMQPNQSATQPTMLTLSTARTTYGFARLNTSSVDFVSAVTSGLLRTTLSPDAFSGPVPAARAPPLSAVSARRLTDIRYEIDSLKPEMPTLGLSVAPLSLSTRVTLFGQCSGCQSPFWDEEQLFCGRCGQKKQ
eukprot:TRINITY_DN5980_c0_g3_i1.p1 TRINITY_DN5980_c0_g3~~TRINITY_DN5980_c0_g3_i1.p1  ORF type:complete len:740 (+),score=131.52 TRINITY_DN5980_c0_g3_i1:952-3171(+)